MARKKLKWSDMRPSEKRDHVIYLIGQILKWLFVGSMCIFTLYPVVYTLLGSFKTNAELTLGGNSCRRTGSSTTMFMLSRSWTSASIS